VCVCACVCVASSHSGTNVSNTIVAQDGLTEQRLRAFLLECEVEHACGVLEEIVTTVEAWEGTQRWQIGFWFGEWVMNGGNGCKGGVVS
jgi:hypothetical protein